MYRLELLHAHCGNSSLPLLLPMLLAPKGSVPHSEPIVLTVRHVTGTGSGLLGGILRVVVQMSALT